MTTSCENWRAEGRFPACRRLRLCGHEDLRMGVGAGVGAPAREEGGRRGMGGRPEALVAEAFMVQVM